MLLCEGIHKPNYVYEPMYYFHQIAGHRTEDKNPLEIDPELAEEYKRELLRAFSNGAPRSNMDLAFCSLRGRDISDGGDVIVKTIRDLSNMTSANI